jgi:hypothetical protein
MGSAEKGIFLTLLFQMLGPTFVFDWHHLIWAKSPCRLGRLANGRVAHTEIPPHQTEWLKNYFLFCF